MCFTFFFCFNLRDKLFASYLLLHPILNITKRKSAPTAVGLIGGLALTYWLMRTGYDDASKGFPGMAYHFQTKNRLQMELHAYMQEIKLADEMGLSSVANQLFENYMHERSILTDYLRK